MNLFECRHATAALMFYAQSFHSSHAHRLAWALQDLGCRGMIW